MSTLSDTVRFAVYTAFNRGIDRRETKIPVYIVHRDHNMLQRIKTEVYEYANRLPVTCTETDIQYMIMFHYIIPAGEYDLYRMLNESEYHLPSGRTIYYPV